MTDIDETLKERGTRYGKFFDHAGISQSLEDTMRFSPGWNKLEVDQKEALKIIVHKIARILNGDPNYHDSWHDIVGYAKLVADRLLKAQTPSTFDRIMSDPRRKTKFEKLTTTELKKNEKKK